MLNLFSRIVRKKVVGSIPLPPQTMTFGDLCAALEVFQNDITRSGGSRAAVAREASFRLESWVRNNWGTKRNIRIPPEVQEVYDEALIEFNRER